MPTILVTGGAGYIGTHTVVNLLEENYDVIVIDNCINANEGRENSIPPSLERVQKITNRKVIFFQVSMQDKEELLNVFCKVMLLYFPSIYYTE